MKEKMKIKVISNDNNEYTVEIQKSWFDKIKKSIGTCLSCCCRFTVFVLLVGSLFLTWQFFKKIKEATNAEKSYVVEEIVEQYSDCRKNEKTKKTINWTFQSLYLLCFVFFSIADIILLVLFIKDDSSIRYRKLCELVSIKEKIDEVIDNNKVIEEKQKKCCCLPKNTEKTTIITEKSNYTELLKHYMSCLTEI